MRGETPAKIEWEGTITSVQPRIRLLRSFDQRYHSYLGYVLRVRVAIEAEERENLVATGGSMQECTPISAKLVCGDVACLWK